MNFILRKTVQFCMKDFLELCNADNPEFTEGLARLKKKLPDSSAPPKRIKKKMYVKNADLKNILDVKKIVLYVLI